MARRAIETLSRVFDQQAQEVGCRNSFPCRPRCLGRLELAQQFILLLGIAPLVSGFIKTLKARLQTRRGPGVLQPYRDLYKLLRKGVVIPETASWLFAVTPYVVFLTTVLAGLMIPMVSTDSPLGLFGGGFGTTCAGCGVGAATGSAPNAPRPIGTWVAAPEAPGSVTDASVIMKPGRTSTKVPTISQKSAWGRFSIFAGWGASPRPSLTPLRHQAISKI